MVIDIALLGLLVIGIVWYVRRTTGTRQRIAQRVRHGVLRGAAGYAARVPGDPSNNVSQRVARRVASIGERMPVVDATQRSKLAMRLARAGFRERGAVSMLAGLKIVVGAGLALVAIATGGHLPRIGEYFVFRALLMAGAFMIGMMLPEFVLGIVIGRRQKSIAAYLPDALDLLVICTNAGNSLAVGIRRVATEMTWICPPLADEFSVTADQLQIGSDSASALNALAARIGLPSVRALVTTLVQSQQYGTPITQSLRVLSRTERTMQIVALEEKAAKLAPKMTLPMMLFIVPTVALIAAGPAVIRLVWVFRHQ
ncbi:type II secretion system F family protein [Burkholderia guangdongensis]|uniref:type II secretion system F family protein n=1 Tax=Burkholderia guangdongensis TaxID=1792500 RepID=UPI0015CD39F5|nr:type II secretion system F family protein [Burkholderia guangdongensis]